MYLSRSNTLLRKSCYTTLVQFNLINNKVHVPGTIYSRVGGVAPLGTGFCPNNYVVKSYQAQNILRDFPVTVTSGHPLCGRSFNIMSQRFMSKKSPAEKPSPETPSSEPKPGNKTSDSESTPPSTSTSTPGTMSRQAKLKQAIKDYGSTVLVFHITMSLCSLGMFYLLVSSGLDMVGLLAKIGIGEKILESRITQGASTFVVAYAVHKVFAPGRIAITLTVTPLIVKKLRSMGILKKPLPK